MPESKPQFNETVSNALILYRLGQMEKKQDKREDKLDKYIDLATKERESLRLLVKSNEQNIKLLSDEVIQGIREDVSDLKKKSNVWDSINVLLIAIGTFLGITK